MEKRERIEAGCWTFKLIFLVLISNKSCVFAMLLTESLGKPVSKTNALSVCLVGWWWRGRGMRVSWKDVFQKLKNMATFPLKVDEAQNRVPLLWKVTFAGAGNYNMDILIGPLCSVPHKKYNWLIINMKRSLLTGSQRNMH